MLVVKNKGYVVFGYFIMFISNLYFFWDHIFNGYWFSNYYDGSKNYYTFFRYISSNTAQEFLKFDEFFYPYGEYVQFIDATPIISIPLKYLNTFYPNLLSYSIPILHIYLFTLMFLTSVLIYKILRKYYVKFYISLLSAIVLPIISPQFLRLVIGHMNLATPFFIVFTIYYYLKVIRFKNASFAFFLASLLVFIMASLTHAYLLALSIFLFGFLAIFDLIYDWRIERKKIFISFYFTSLIPLILPFILVMGIFINIDDYSSERNIKGSGFNWVEWNLTPDSLINSYEWSKIKIFNYVDYNLSSENSSYIGIFALSFILYVIGKYLFNSIKGNNRNKFDSNNYIKKERFVFICVIVALIFTASGTYTHVFNRQLQFDNLINPFYYLVRLSDAFTQFRVLARFNWPIFWLVNILCIITFDRIYKKAKSKRVSVGLLILFSILMLSDYFSLIDNKYLYNNHIGLFDINAITAIKNDFKEIDSKEYQAILPIPIYVSGAFSGDLTMDPEDGWCNKTYQLNIALNLPLISVKADRSSELKTKALMSIVSNNPNNNLLHKLETDGRDILVIKSKINNSWNLNFDSIAYPYAHQTFLNCVNFELNKDVELLKETDEYCIYKLKIENL